MSEDDGPRSLERMMSVAKLAEEWVSSPEEPPDYTSGGSQRHFRLGLNRSVGPTTSAGHQQGSGPNIAKPKTGNTFSSNSSPNRQDGRNPNTFGGNRPKTAPIKLTAVEIAKRKADGLCFWCPERFHSKHLCPNKELRLLVVLEDGNEIEWTEEDHVKTETTAQAVTEMAELSLNSLVGISSPHTIKLKGSIQGHELVVLIDSGATHNFLSGRWAAAHGITTTNTGGYFILIGGGITVQGKGVCQSVTLTMQGYSMTSHFIPLELGSADVILGIQWLETLGDTQSNCKLQVMKFWVDGKEIVLQGDPSLCYSQVTLKPLWKTVERGREGVLVELSGLETFRGGDDMSPAEELLSTLDEFAQVFAEPTGLPPAVAREGARNCFTCRLESGECQAVSLPTGAEGGD